MLPEISDLIRCSAVFLPADPARTGRMAFWRPDGQPPPAPARNGRVTAPTEPTEPTEPPELPDLTEPPGLTDLGELVELTVVTSGLQPTTVTARVLPLAAALPLLTRARTAPGPVTAPAFWGAAALLALRFAARGLLLPGLSASDHDAWRIGPLDAADLAQVRALAAAMPAAARCVPSPAGADPLRLPAAEPLLRAFLDAVADTLPRSPAAPAAAGAPAFAAPEPGRFPDLRPWAAEVAAGHDAGVRISLRVELTERTGSPDAPGFRAVLQLHSLSDAALVADAAEVWAGSGPAAAGFAPRARMDALLALRRAARLWPPLTPLLTAAVPDSVELADEEVIELLGAAAAALAADGVQVHWPRGLARDLTAHAVVGSGPDAGTSDAGTPALAPAPAADPARPARTGLLSPDALLSFDWRHSLGDQADLTPAELDRLAESNRPLVRLRDQWVLIDPAEARRARARQDRKVTTADALAAVLTGAAEVDGLRVAVTATGPLERLRAELAADPEDPAARTSSARQPVAQPAALAAELRDYQLRGLAWLARMTALGLGGCLADDMGLGKTITLIALHLHRRQDPATAGPTLVVCPASLLGNWQREFARFAPGTPVQRFHGAGRSLAGLPADAVVLTTYGTLRLDAPALAKTPWGLVVADEAQHVKNPQSSTARALRTVPSPARVALTGTPVENNLTELWAILDWTTPGLLGRLGTFRRRYAEAVEQGRDPQAAARLGSLVRPFLLRRKKSDPGIAPELPPKTETDHAVALSPEQAGLYEAVVRETLAAISAADGMERRGLIVKLLTSLKQICNHPAQYTKEGGSGGGRSGKLELLDELLDTILAEGGSVLVFTQYVTMARILEKHLAARGINSQLLHGGTPVPRREELVDRFQSGEVPVFLLSLKAAGTGLNLTRAAHVIHYDRWWNPAVEEQATDRAYRIGQTQPVQVHRIIAEGTVEDRIAEMLARKRALADAVLAGGEAALTELTDAELAELVALRAERDGGNGR
ncbi:DEAD/DEAH box helicase [Streptomyces sp. NPDC051211]|uniref:DEAD/DEAH box helicase n=1 Tax=Streptomyces sp. NPDC051211 TaxID=3154643 RepID=UPI00344B467D